MDFAIIQGPNGQAEMSWDKPTNIGNLLYFSINIKKGTLFDNPNFGLDLSDIKKLTNEKIPLIQERVEKAVKWILDIGKAKEITVVVEKNTQAIGRVDIYIKAIQADGTPVEYSTFRSVGGSADGFSL
jgi:hypothetical protein